MDCMAVGAVAVAVELLDMAVMDKVQKMHQDSLQEADRIQDSQRK